MPHVPLQLQPWMELAGAFADAAETGVRRAHRALTSRSTPAGRARRPGSETPMWNVLAARVRAQTRTYGAQARLARYLGVPRQRLHNYLIGRTRLPDAEIALRLLHWVAEVEAGRDPTI